MPMWLRYLKEALYLLTKEPAPEEVKYAFAVASAQDPRYEPYSEAVEETTPVDLREFASTIFDFLHGLVSYGIAILIRTTLEKEINPDELKLDKREKRPLLVYFEMVLGKHINRLTPEAALLLLYATILGNKVAVAVSKAPSVHKRVHTETFNLSEFEEAAVEEEEVALS